MRHHHCGHRGMHFGRRGGFGGGAPDFIIGWGMGAGRGGFGHGERGGRRRMFDGTELRLILLKLIEESKSEGAKKQFAITEAGTAHLAERTEEVAALFERLQQLAGLRERANGGPIRRAMGNLRTVLQERLAGESVDADMLHGVAEILDEAARKIERL